MGQFCITRSERYHFYRVIWYAAGALIRKFFVGHKETVVSELAELERLKNEAAEHLAEVERRVAGVDRSVKNFFPKVAHRQKA